MSDLHGYYIEDLEDGMKAAFTKTVSQADIVLYAGITGDTNPLHLDEEYAATTMFETRIAHGMLTAGFISAVLGTKLPGPGCVYLSQDMKFLAPVRVGDTVRAEVEVASIDRDRRKVTLNCACSVRDTPVLNGEALMLVPSRPDPA